MSKSQKPNHGFPKPLTQGQKFKVQSNPSNSHINKYFLKTTSSKESVKNEEIIVKPKMSKNRNVTISDDDADFESPKMQKKKIIKWELTKTKVYSKKSSKSKKPVTNSTIKIIEDNFKDLDVNPEHLQMGILLSKSEYEANKLNSQTPLEDTPDFNTLTGTILDRFGFKSDKPVTRSDLNIPEKMKKRKFKYTTPILIARTEADRDSLLAANISLILSKNRGNRNSKKSFSQCKLFSEILQNRWCKENRIFCLSTIYETGLFTVKELNLPLERAHHGYLLREWNTIPAISEKSAENTKEKSCEQQDSTVNKAKELKSDEDSFKVTANGCNIFSDKLNAPVIEIHKVIDTKIENKAEVCKKQNFEASKIDSSRIASTDLSIIISPVNNETTLEHSPVKENIRFNRSLSPELFSSDNDFSFTQCEKITDKFEDSLTLKDNQKHVESLKSMGCDSNKKSKTDDKNDSYVIVIDDDEDEPESLKSFTSKDLEISSINIYSAKQKVKYSFDSDSDQETECLKITSKAVNNYSLGCLNKGEAKNLSKSIANAKKDNVNHSFEFDLENESEYCGSKLTGNKINVHKNINSEEFNNCSSKDLNRCSLNEKLDNSLKEINNAKFEDITLQKKKSFKISLNENDSIYNNLNVTEYISNMLNSQDESFADSNNRTSIECLDKINDRKQKDCEKNRSYNIRAHSLTQNGSTSDPMTNEIFELEDNLSQSSQSNSFINELNKTDFCNIPAIDTMKISRNSTGESGFWSEGKEPDTIDISDDEITYQNVGLNNEPIASTSPDALEPLTNFVTPDKSTNSKLFKNVIIKTNDVTPMQDYDTMNTPTINKELDKYGIKPLKRTRGATLLKHIYESTHPLIGEHREGYVHETDEENRMVKKRKSNELFPSLGTAGGIEIVGDLLLKNEPMENLIFERKPSARIWSCRVPLQIVWHNFVSSNRELKENILLYEPLELELLHQGLKEIGYKFHIQDLLTFLDKKCITVRIKR